MRRLANPLAPYMKDPVFRFCMRAVLRSPPLPLGLDEMYWRKMDEIIAKNPPRRRKRRRK